MKKLDFAERVEMKLALILQLRGRGSFFFFLGNLILISDCSTVELKQNTTIIVLGASGDLAKKKTVCACSPPFTQTP